MNKTNPKRLPTILFHLCNTFEMTELCSKGQVSGCRGLEGEKSRMKTRVKREPVMMTLTVVIDAQTYIHNKLHPNNMHAHMCTHM